MASNFAFGLVLLLSVWLPAQFANLPEGVHQMECHERYFTIAVNISFIGEEPHFEAVDGTGAHPITPQYAAECGYTISVLPLSARIELRASYFSCHTDNKDDKLFTFNFNLIGKRSGKEVSHTMSKTCSPPSWSPREITCGINYMEVAVRSDLACPSAMRTIADDAVEPVAASTTSDWQVKFQSTGEQTMAMNLSEARKQGFVFDLTPGNLVFRTPYGHPYSVSKMVNGVPVEVVHATVFSRQSWLVLLIDLVAACSMDQGSFVNGYMVWKSPEAIHPLASGVSDGPMRLGLNGELLEQPTAEDGGFTVEKINATVEIGIPYNAEGGYRKTLVSGDLYEFYIFNLFLEQAMVDEDDAQTRVRYHRTMVTPMLPRPVFTDDRTNREDGAFTIYLGDLAEDMELTSVQLNGHVCEAPFTNTSCHNVTKAVHSNKTHGYTLTVPFFDPMVTHEFSREDGTLTHTLDINYTLAIPPENEPFYHHMSVMALTKATPPELEAVCSETGITFKLDHRPFDYLWYISICADRLTPALAAERNYSLSNDSKSLVLEVPLYTNGYEYTNYSLQGFHGTFELCVRDDETSEIQRKIVKTCSFRVPEFILCSTDGRMTVVADVSEILRSGGTAARTNLKDTHCGPKETDDTRAFFSFPLNTCGSSVKFHKGNVVYENEISYSKKLVSGYMTGSDGPTEKFKEGELPSGKVTVQCTYSLVGLHRLFSVYSFESDSAGVGRILNSPLLMDSWTTTKPTTTAPQTTTTGQTAGPQPAFQSSVRYIKFFPFYRFRSLRRGLGRSSRKY